MVVYLIHLDQKLSNKAEHYIGFSKKTAWFRLKHHRAGVGARMLKAANEAGISYHVSRIWPGKGRTFERFLKNKKKIKLFCPICNAKISDKKYGWYKR